MIRSALEINYTCQCARGKILYLATRFLSVRSINPHLSWALIPTRNNRMKEHVEMLRKTLPNLSAFISCPLLLTYSCCPSHVLEKTYPFMLIQT